MKILVLQEGSRANETGYQYLDLKNVIDLLQSGTMKATNRKLGLDKSRLSKSTLKLNFEDILRPVVSEKEIAKYMQDENCDRKEAIKYFKEEEGCISPEDGVYISSIIKDYEKMTVGDVLDKNLLDVRLSSFINPSAVEFIDKKDANRFKKELRQETYYNKKYSQDKQYQSNSWSYESNGIPTSDSIQSPSVLRIALDIDKISSNQSVNSYKRDDGSREERISGDTNHIGRYIKSIDFPEEINDTNHYIMVKKDTNIPVGKSYKKDFIDELKDTLNSNSKPEGNLFDCFYGKTEELITLSDYYKRCIEKELSSLSLGIKTYEDLLTFIKNAEDKSVTKLPGKKNKKSVITKLNIATGTYRQSVKTYSKEEVFSENDMKVYQDVDKFIKTGVNPVKKETKISAPVQVTANKVSDKPVSNSSKDFIVKGLSELGNYSGKIYLVASKKTTGKGKDGYSWSNFLLSSNVEKDLEKLSKKNPTDIIILLKPQAFKATIVNPPLRNKERAIARKLYIKELEEIAHKSSGSHVFDNLESFCEFIHSQYFDINGQKNSLKVGICTGNGGLTIGFGKSKLKAKYTPTHV